MTPTTPVGYMAIPHSGKGNPVLVLHAWWGLNTTIKEFCDRLAESGFMAFAPDLYHGKVANTISGAEALGKALDANYIQAKAEIVEALKFLEERANRRKAGVAVIGFSLGAYYALELSNTEPDHVHSVVVFYGTGHEDFNRSKAAYLGHFAEDDPFEPKSGVDHLEDLLKQAGCPVTIHRYPGTGHWFFEIDRMDAYNKAAANLAWDRTLAFIRRTSG